MKLVARPIKPVPKVSDPPAISAADLERVRQESDRLGAAYLERTASMERLTAEDVLARCR